jgi:hypothetical protein
MGGAVMRIILSIIIAGCFVSTPAFAQQWLLVKDKSGKCEIMRTKPEITIIEGPFRSKAEAEKALKEVCGPDKVHPPK